MNEGINECGRYSIQYVEEKTVFYLPTADDDVVDHND